LLAAFFLSAKFVRKMVAARAATEECSSDDGKPIESQLTTAPGAEANVDLRCP
jgi:hypothetical protein